MLSLFLISLSLIGLNLLRDGINQRLEIIGAGPIRHKQRPHQHQAEAKPPDTEMRGEVMMFVCFHVDSFVVLLGNISIG